jgi:hypothetical protein
MSLRKTLLLILAAWALFIALLAISSFALNG